MTTQNKNNTPTRDRKIGMSDPPQANSGAEQKVAVTEPSKMVQNMAAQEFAKKQTIASTTRNDKVGLTGGSAFGQNTAAAAPTTTVTAPTTPTPMAGTAGNAVIGRFEPQQTGKSPTVDSTNMKDAVDTTKQPQTNSEGTKTPETWNPNTDVGYISGSDDPNYYATLSEALNKQKSQTTPEFTRDENQRDGGFFGWLKGLLPKNRPGKREGETDDEYDARITRNKKRLAILADAIRHMGNIINTSKGAPVQLYNDPSALLEQGYQQRKADRQKQDELKAENERKQQELTLKQQAAKADQDYKNLTFKLNLDKFEYQKGRDAVKDAQWQAAFKQKADENDRKFAYRQARDKVKDGQWQAAYGIRVANLNLSKARLAHTLSKDSKGGGVGDSAFAYPTPYGSLYSKKQLSAQQEQSMWDFMVRNKQITAKKLKEYQLAAKGDGGMGLYGTDKGSTSRARKIIQECISYGLMDATKKGDDFRKFCTTQLGMGEDRVYSTPQNATTWNKGSKKQGQTGKWSIK